MKSAVAVDMRRSARFRDARTSRTSSRGIHHVVLDGRYLASGGARRRGHSPAWRPPRAGAAPRRADARRLRAQSRRRRRRARAWRAARLVSARASPVRPGRGLAARPAAGTRCLAGTTRSAAAASLLPWAERARPLARFRGVGCGARGPCRICRAGLRSRSRPESTGGTRAARPPGRRRGARA